MPTSAEISSKLDSIIELLKELNRGIKDLHEEIAYSEADEND
jgi:hypothetical protein